MVVPLKEIPTHYIPDAIMKEYEEEKLKGPVIWIITISTDKEKYC